MEQVTEEARNFHKKYYSITRKGIRKLNTLLIDASWEEVGLKTGRRRTFQKV
jgi:hypothetical protein